MFGLKLRLNKVVLYREVFVILPTLTDINVVDKIIETPVGMTQYN